MGKIYLEVVTSTYVGGVLMRDEDVVEYILLDIDIPTCYDSVAHLEEVNTCIVEAIEKYASENDIMLGREYIAKTGCHVQKCSKIVFMEKENGYFRKLRIRSFPSVSLNWIESLTDWKTDGNKFWVEKRRYLRIIN